MFGTAYSPGGGGRAGRNDLRNKETELLSMEERLRKIKSEMPKMEMEERKKKKEMDSKSRYENGKIGFLDYSNAQSDKDKSTLDFLQLLRKKWELYYKIRKLTLYDFKTNQKITYKE